ncbi:MAG TPA: hypothetical protein DCF41_00300 [Arcobacter skirrowii]|nr:hypothetical protein [Aliarcobacter skirrowii]
MKRYLANKQTKDARFLTLFRKAFNKDRLRNGFTSEESANELGLSLGTLEQKLKPSTENDITVSEWNHHLELTADFSTLEYMAFKHGFALKKLDIVKAEKSINEINSQADKTMLEFNEAWATIKHVLDDGVFDKKERSEALREINEAMQELKQLHSDVINTKVD